MPALSSENYQLFAARPGYTEFDSELWSRIQNGYGGGYEQFYG